MTSPFSLAEARSKRAYGPKPRQQSNIWGVVEAMLYQRRKKKTREQKRRMESLIEQVRWPAWLHQHWSFHLRSSGFYIPAMHRHSHHAEEVQPTTLCSHSPAIPKLESEGVEWKYRGAFRAARDSLIK